MFARLHFPEAAIRRLHDQGLLQRNPEKLRWTDQHPASHYGAGVLLRGKSGDLLDGAQFRALRDAFGAWIETDQPERVARALGLPWQADHHEPGIITAP